MSAFFDQSDPPLPTRRAFIRQSAITSGFVGLGLYLKADQQGEQTKRVISPYGPLVPDRNKLLDLPAGFTYEVISRRGGIMSDGLRVPGMFDDMAAFPGEGGRIIIIRNHELALNQSHLGAFPRNRLPSSINRDLVYDPGRGDETPQPGGTTTIVYNPATGKTEKEFLSLAGSHRNCSGGATPWGSWITCEETFDLVSDRRARMHGYCFEVKADPELGLQRAVPLKALGRFCHEGVAYAPEDGSLYLTEDRGDGLLYRFVPERARDFSSGKLYALAVSSIKSADLRNNQSRKVRHIKEGQRLSIHWIQIEDPSSPKDELRASGFKKGAARFARGEGIFYDRGSLFLCCTDGGPSRRGQVFRITPHGSEGREPQIELFLESGESDLLTSGDNLCVAPNGDLVICEDLIDPFKKRQFQHLRGVTPEGKIFTLARNPDGANKYEFCGSTFSPDGSILFVNIQTLDHTFAIRGPWRS